MNGSRECLLTVVDPSDGGAADADEVGREPLPLRETEIRLLDLHAHATELERQNRALRQEQVALLSSRRFYQDLFDDLPWPSLVLDADQTVLEANRAAEALLGVPRPALLGRPFIRWTGPGRSTASPRDRQARPIRGFGHLRLVLDDARVIEVSVRSRRVVRDGGVELRYVTLLPMAMASH